MADPNYTRIRISLTCDEVRALAQQARAQCRAVPDQAAWLIRESLSRRPARTTKRTEAVRP